MPLPDLLEIVPPSGPVEACVTVPGSKSLTNRALVLAALSAGETRLEGALWSEDTQVMVSALRVLGFGVDVADDPGDASNRTLTVRGGGGVIPGGGTAEAPLELHVGNAGTAARFLSALVCLGRGVYRLSGVDRMHERPQAALFAALRQLGYRVDTPNDHLPAVIHGGGRRPGRCTVAIGESSQFASALELCAAAGGWDVVVSNAGGDDASYVAMTRALREAFPSAGGVYGIEPDASGGSYFLEADWLLSLGGPNPRRGMVTVRDWPVSGWQIDARYPGYLEPDPECPDRPRTSRPVSRRRDLGDAIMTAIVGSVFNRSVRSPAVSGEPVFVDLGRLRVQECERVAALRTELGRCGVVVEEVGDTLTVGTVGEPHGAEVATYGDHRMAMCFAILGLKVPGIRIQNPGCVRKTFPDFFRKLALPAPAGLGVTLLDAGMGGRRLGLDDLATD